MGNSYLKLQGREPHLWQWVQQPQELSLASLRITAPNSKEPSDKYAIISESGSPEVFGSHIRESMDLRATFLKKSYASCSAILIAKGWLDNLNPKILVVN